ncbi:MAG TPA: pyridoxamine 5'-phosphate oxidase family protein [Thermomicrobiales bacterium]|nr:pyridoxamine 5'-phosphate oxidase family protein [Thermomicrobiales bacterium]
MNQADVLAVLNDPVSRRLIDSSNPVRLAYTGKDGFPRVVPLAFHWNGSQFVIGTIPGSAKTGTLAVNPKVAMTIYTTAFPPNVLLVRGTASLELVDGVPDEYIEANRKQIPAGMFPEWQNGVRHLYKEMVLIKVTPEWAKVMDFETRLPRSVEKAVRAAF